MILVPVLVFVVMFFLLILASDHQVVENGDSASDSATVSEFVEENLEGIEENQEAEFFSPWKYTEETDPMTDKTTYYAQVTSNNYVRFSFPYNSSLIYLTLTVRKSPRYGTDVFIRVPEGQFKSSYTRGTNILVRFDEETPTKWSCNEPSDGSTEILFINNTTKFISKLKRSKKVRISAEFYHEGAPTFIFDTEGFEWNH